MVEEKKTTHFIKGLEAEHLVLSHAKRNALEVVDTFRERHSVEIWLKNYDHKTTVSYYITEHMTVETLYMGV